MAAGEDRNTPYNDGRRRAIGPAPKSVHFQAIAPADKIRRPTDQLSFGFRTNCPRARNSSESVMVMLSAFHPSPLRKAAAYEPV